MQLQYFAPRADLRDLVRSYYLFETSEPAQQVMSAEMGNVRFLLAGEGRVFWPDGSMIRFRRASLLGPTHAAYAMEASGGARVFGAGILPRGWRVLFGVSAEELADQGEELAAVVGRPAVVAIEQMANAPDAEALVAAANAFFARLRDGAPRRAGAAFPDAMQDWLVGAEELSLDALLAAMDVSRRQTDRLAKTFFGASPKLLQRKYRALRAGDRFLAGTAQTWRESAGAGFYDQSHFIREFRTFLGATPGEYLKRRGLAAFARGERLRSGAAHPLSGL